MVGNSYITRIGEGLPVIHSVSRAGEAALLLRNQQSGAIHMYLSGRI